MQIKAVRSRYGVRPIGVAFARPAGRWIRSFAILIVPALGVIFATGDDNEELTLAFGQRARLIPKAIRIK